MRIVRIIVSSSGLMATWKVISEYQMVVDLFGAASSPSCSNVALCKTGEDNSQHFPEAAVSTVKNNFYVDDCLKALLSVEEASQHASNLQCLLSKGGFKLTKWISNSRKVLETIPEEEHAKEVKTLDLGKDDLPLRELSVLNGVWKQTPLASKWTSSSNHPHDGASFQLSVLFMNPPGLAVPFVFLAKLLLQDLCRVKLEWDDPISSEHKVHWEQWLADLPKISQFTVEHCVKPVGFNVISSSQLHHFSDASETGPGSVSYIRLANVQGDVHCTFLSAKSLVSPLKTITVPRLELSAAAIPIKQDKVLR